MRKLKIVIVEDDYRAMVILKDQLHYLEMELVGEFANLTEFNAGYPGLEFDLAIVDLQLNSEDRRNRDGWTIIARLMKNRAFPTVVYTGHTQEEVLRKLDVYPTMEYLQKGGGMNRSAVATTITKALVNTHGSYVLDIFHFPHLNKNEYELNDLVKRQFTLRSAETKEFITLHISAVKAIETNSRGIKIHHLNGSHVFRETLKGFQEKYSHPDLMQINQSHLVNRNYVEKANLDYAYVRIDGRPTPFSVSQSYRPVIRDYLNWLGSR